MPIGPRQHALRDRPELPLIRPPNEAESVLVRLTRGCNWNQCRFCGIYAHFGQPRFEIRGVDEVKRDIDRCVALWPPSAQYAFFGDADPLIMKPQRFVDITRYLYDSFPKLQRLTCYCRSATAWARRNHLIELGAAGLRRVHVGLESGADNLLQFHRKGVTAARHLEAGLALRQARIEVSYYVLLGMGGAEHSETHVRETVRLLNEIRPEFVRFRRLWIYGDAGGACSPLYSDVQTGAFTPQSPEGTVLELRGIIHGLNFPTQVEALHHNDYVRLAGTLPSDRESLLAAIDEFLRLPEEEKQRVYNRPSAI